MSVCSPQLAGVLPRITRRNALQIGGFGLLGLSLPQFFAAQSAAETRTPETLTPRIKSCILIFYYGGPSHIDTFDMKPTAPVEVRGEFKSIATSLPGVRVCEHMPHTARIMHKVSLVRSMQHRMRGHDSASYIALTGRVPPVGDNQNFGERPDSFPCMSSCLSYAFRNKGVLVPAASLPYVMNNNIANPGQTAGFLGPAFQPLSIQGDSRTLTYNAGGLSLLDGVTPERLSQRMDLFRYFNKTDSDSSMNVFCERAFELLSSNGVREALNIEQESQATRERYGFGEAGQKYDDNPKSTNLADLAIGRNMRGLNLLMARRLVESGVPFINVYDYKQQGKNWDTHSKNFLFHKDHLVPPADKAFAALIEDLDERGLLDTTLVVGVGEFGRTPRVNATAGRDHWPDCYTAVIAGGPVKRGYIHGASDSIGAYPITDPVTPADLAATIFDLFGVRPDTVIRDPGGRPFHISDGSPVHDLMV